LADSVVWRPCCRALEIIYEVNRRLLDDVRRHFPNEAARVTRMSLIEEKRRPAGSNGSYGDRRNSQHNGVSAIHSELLRATTVPDFAEMFPERFNNKTNGVTPRRWLLLANPDLSSAIIEAIGHRWTTNLDELRKLEPLAADSSFQEAVQAAKQAAKVRFANWLRLNAGAIVDPESVFDCQISEFTNTNASC